MPQGWSLSCVLFNLVIDPLLRELERELPSLFQSAFADDLCFHHHDSTILPAVQKFINQYGNAVGLAVNEKKCAVITLCNVAPTNSIWRSPIVTSYRYLGVLLGKGVKKDEVFEQAIRKLEERAKLFSVFKSNYSTKVLIAKIYLYPLLSYLLNFYSFSKTTERRFTSAVQRFIFSFNNIDRRIMFAYPSITPGGLSLENPRAYAIRFTFTFGDGEQPRHLLERDKHPPLPVKLSPTVLLDKMSSLIPVTVSLILNYSAITTIKHNLSHFFMLLLLNCLPFHSRVHHFMDIADTCAICGANGGDNPTHLLSECSTGRSAMILLQSEEPQLLSDFSRIESALLSTQVVSGDTILKHLCFAKALWKARCAALWSDDTMSPFRIAAFYHEALRKHKKLKCNTNIPPIVSVDVVNDYNVRSSSLV